MEDYERLAVRLARHPEELRAVQARLAKNRLTQPLFDTLGFLRNLEIVYKEMWRIFLAGASPTLIEVGNFI